MLARLDELLGTDNASRWRIISISASAIAMWGIASELRGIPVRDAQISATIVGALIFLVQVCTYCLRSPAPTVHVERAVGMPRRLAMGAVAAGVIIFLSIVPLPVVEAAVVSRRLRVLMPTGTLQASDVPTVTDILDTIHRSNVKVPASTLTRVRDALTILAAREPDSTTIPRAMDSLAQCSAENRPQAIPPAIESELNMGIQHLRRGIPPWPERIDPAEANAAAIAFTRALQLAAGNPAAQIMALLLRATTYSNLPGKYDQALTDAEDATKLGALDVPWIVSIESTVYYDRDRPEDRRRAVNLLTRALCSNTPPRAAVISGATAEQYRLELLGKRAGEYYRLGEFEKAIDDAMQALPLARKEGFSPASLYKWIIGSYLLSGRPENALKAAKEWEKATGEPEATTFRTVLEQKPADPQQSMNRLGIRSLETTFGTTP